MSNLYVIVCDGVEWEDLAIYTEVTDAKLALLRMHKRTKGKWGFWIEKFSKQQNEDCFTPAYERIVINCDSIKIDEFNEEDDFPDEWFASIGH